MNDFKTLGDDHRQYPGAAIDPTTGKFRVEQLPMDLASWEGSVLPALRAAIASWPELQGAVLERLPSKYGIMAQITVPGIAAVAQDIDTRTAGGVIEDCRVLAHVTAYRVSTVLPPDKPTCEVCDAIAGWAPACSSCRAKAAAAAEWAAWPEVTLETKSPPCATFSKAKDFLTTKWDDHEGRLRRAVWRERLATKYEVTRTIDPSDPCAPPAGFAFRRTEFGIAVYHESGGPGFRMPRGLRSCTYWNARTNAQQIERYPATANDAPGRWDGCEEARDWAAWALGEA